MALGRVETTSVIGTTMSNPFCHLVNVEWPIVQAAMGGASCPVLSAAVSNAGGLGMLALSWSSADETRREIRRTRELTAHPFGVNLVLDWPTKSRFRSRPPAPWPAQSPRVPPSLNDKPVVYAKPGFTRPAEAAIMSKAQTGGHR